MCSVVLQHSAIISFNGLMKGICGEWVGSDTSDRSYATWVLPHLCAMTLHRLKSSNILSYFWPKCFFLLIDEGKKSHSYMS